MIDLWSAGLGMLTSGMPLPSMPGGQDGLRKTIGQFADSGIGKALDPQGFMKQYNPWSTDEDKYGQKPGAFDPNQYSGLGGGAGGGLDSMYQQQLSGLGNVGQDDAYLGLIMDRAGAGASRDAKLRGLSGPYSVNANERARQLAGMEYAQKENARRQALRAQLLGQYGDWSERRRQFNTGLAYDRYKSEVDAYNQRLAGHNALLNTIPFVGRGLNAEATGRRGAY